MQQNVSVVSAATYKYLAWVLEFRRNFILIPRLGQFFLLIPSEFCRSKHSNYLNYALDVP